MIIPTPPSIPFDFWFWFLSILFLSFDFWWASNFWISNCGFLSDSNCVCCSLSRSSCSWLQISYFQISYSKKIIWNVKVSWNFRFEGLKRPCTWGYITVQKNIPPPPTVIYSLNQLIVYFPFLQLVAPSHLHLCMGISLHLGIYMRSWWNRQMPRNRERMETWKYYSTIGNFW